MFWLAPKRNFFGDPFGNKKKRVGNSFGQFVVFVFYGSVLGGFMDNCFEDIKIKKEIDDLRG